MRPSLRKLTLLSCVILGAGLSSIAGPLQRVDVAAEPAWVMHIDCDALRPTSLGQYLLAEMDKPDARPKLAAFQTLFSFDPRKQLHGLTLYSAGSAPEDAVLLVYADFDAERLVTLAKAARDSRSTPYKKNVIYNWIDDKKQATNGILARTYAAIAGSRVVLFAHQEKCVAKALDVLDRAAPNLAAGKVFPQLGASGNTSFIEASARKLDIPDSTPNAAMFRLAKGMQLQVGEVKGKVTATLSFEANSEEVAKQAASVVHGMLALVRWQSQKPEIGKLAQALSLKQDGPSVVATLAMPAADVIGLIQAEAGTKEKQKAEKD